MDRAALLTIVLAGAVVLIGLMGLGWRSRKRRQAGIAVPPTAPAGLGVELRSFSGKYVATTVAGDPMNRIAAHGLGFRGAVDVRASAPGLLLHIAGAPEVWIDRSTIRDIRRATWTIDRVVETDGLHVVAWMLGDTGVDTYLRLDDPLGFDAATTEIIERHAS